MPLIRTTKSVIGRSIVGGVEKFLNDNAAAMENDTDITPEDGAKATAHAIAYGIAKALSDQSVQAAFAAGICPPAGGPVGNLIYTPLSNVSREP